MACGAQPIQMPRRFEPINAATIWLALRSNNERSPESSPGALRLRWTASPGNQCAARHQISAFQNQISSAGFDHKKAFKTKLASAQTQIDKFRVFVTVTNDVTAASDRVPSQSRVGFEPLQARGCNAHRIEQFRWPEIAD